MKTRNPIRREGVYCHRMEDECLLYDGEHSKIHVLNEIAGFVWEKCDGDHSVRDIVDEVRGRYDAPEEPVLTEDLQSIIRDLAALGLIESGTDGPRETGAAPNGRDDLG